MIWDDCVFRKTKNTVHKASDINSLFRADMRGRGMYFTRYLRLQTFNPDEGTTVGILSSKAFIWVFKRPICTFFKASWLHFYTWAEFCTSDNLIWLLKLQVCDRQADTWVRFPSSRAFLWDFKGPICTILRYVIDTFTPWRNFESLTISLNYSSYRHAIIKLIPGLDSPHWEHSLEALNVSFAPFSSYLPYTFTPGRNFGPPTISDYYSGYRHAIVTQIPRLASPR